MSDVPTGSAIPTGLRPTRFIYRVPLITNNPNDYEMLERLDYSHLPITPQNALASWDTRSTRAYSQQLIYILSIRVHSWPKLCARHDNLAPIFPT